MQIKYPKVPQVGKLGLENSSSVEVFPLSHITKEYLPPQEEEEEEEDSEMSNEEEEEGEKKEEVKEGRREKTDKEEERKQQETEEYRFVYMCLPAYLRSTFFNLRVARPGMPRNKVCL